MRFQLNFWTSHPLPPFLLGGGKSAPPRVPIEPKTPGQIGLSTQILLLAQFPELEFCMEEYAPCFELKATRCMDWIVQYSFSCGYLSQICTTKILSIYPHKFEFISCFELENMKTWILAYIPWVHKELSLKQGIQSYDFGIRLCTTYQTQVICSDRVKSKTN